MKKNHTKIYTSFIEKVKRGKIDQNHYKIFISARRRMNYAMKGRKEYSVTIQKESALNSICSMMKRQNL